MGYGAQVFKLVDDFIRAKGEDPILYAHRPAAPDDSSTSDEGTLSVAEYVPMPKFSGKKRSLDGNEEMDDKFKRVRLEMENVRYPQHIMEEMVRVREDTDMEYVVQLSQRTKRRTREETRADCCFPSTYQHSCCEEEIRSRGQQGESSHCILWSVQLRDQRLQRWKEQGYFQ